MLACKLSLGTHPGGFIMNKVLMTAVIVLPLVMFLAFFGENIMSVFKTNTDDAKTKADALKTTADKGAGF